VYKKILNWLVNSVDTPWFPKLPFTFTFGAEHYVNALFSLHVYPEHLIPRFTHIKNVFKLMQKVVGFYLQARDILNTVRKCPLMRKEKRRSGSFSEYLSRRFEQNMCWSLRRPRTGASQIRTSGMLERREVESKHSLPSRFIGCTSCKLNTCRIAVAV
jgi:hypothetical protein